MTVVLQWGIFILYFPFFSYHELGTTTSPFLLLDHLGPGKLEPKSKKRGVNEHPHRGFETVTIMFKGELEHRDSTGGGGVISAGDVQWMTAASGVQHIEQFSPAFREQGGDFEMIQLWVNLPAKYKMTTPRYQSIPQDKIVKIQLKNDAGFIRVIAGEYQDTIGPAITYSPMSVLDVFIKKGEQMTLPAKHGDSTLLYLRSGRIQFSQDDELLEEQGMAVMSSLGENLVVTTLQDSQFLLLTGQPLHEPIIGQGPFVMNTHDEILQAYDDIKHGNFSKPLLDHQ